MANNVKFYRLGLNTVNGVSVEKYNSYKLPGAMVFAKVNVGAGTWDSTESLYKAPAYYIWANGLEYKVADADALQYALQHIGSSEQKIKDIDASIDRLDSSVSGLEEMVQEIQDSYVKSLSVDSESEFVVLEPADINASTGDVAFSIDLKMVDVSTASESNDGLASAYNIQKYVLSKVAEAGHLKYKVVDQLPETGEENIIYLVKAEDPHRQQGDVYNEYMWIDGKWEKLGDTTLNLDNYYTKDEVDVLLEELTEDLTEYIDSQDSSLKDYVDIADASLAEAIEDAIDSFEELILEEKAEREAKEAEIDASIDRLDASVNALEEKVLTGVVNSISSDSLNDYVSITKNTNAVGDVDLYVDATVQNHYDMEATSVAAGLVTSNYVEERLEWNEVEEDVEPEAAAQQDGTYVNEGEGSLVVSNLNALNTTASSTYDLTSKSEIKIG